MYYQSTTYIHNLHCTTVPVDSVSFQSLFCTVLVAVLLSLGFGFTFSTTNIAKLEVETRLEMGVVMCYGGLPSGKNEQHTANSWLTGSKIIIIQGRAASAAYVISANPCEFAYHVKYNLPI